MVNKKINRKKLPPELRGGDVEDLFEKALWNFHWRLHDEIIHRKKKKRKGGYFKMKDNVSKKSDKELAKESAMLTFYRTEKHGFADT